MSERDQAGSPVSPWKSCIRCGGAMSRTRPPTLLATPDGAIVGPFHAGCAERVKMEAERNPKSNWLMGAAEYGRVLPAREETLPW